MVISNLRRPDPAGQRRRAERLFGYTCKELVGQMVEILVPRAFRDSHPRRRAGYRVNPRARSMGEGVELTGLRKDNSEFPIEISLSPIRTSEGTLISSAIRDVTARREAQEALRASEERHRMAVEVTELGTWEWNIERDELIWSDQFRTPLRSAGRRKAIARGHDPHDASRGSPSGRPGRQGDDPGRSSLTTSNTGPCRPGTRPSPLDRRQGPGPA